MHASKRDPADERLEASRGAATVGGRLTTSWASACTEPALLDMLNRDSPSLKALAMQQFSNQQDFVNRIDEECGTGPSLDEETGKARG
jgi:hypothetical protein